MTHPLDYIPADEACEECGERGTILILRAENETDRLLCEQDAINDIYASNNDQHGFDRASADAALQSMLIEGSAIKL